MLIFVPTGHIWFSGLEHFVWNSLPFSSYVVPAVQLFEQELMKVMKVFKIKNLVSFVYYGYRNSFKTFKLFNKKTHFARVVF